LISISIPSNQPTNTSLSPIIGRRFHPLPQPPTTYNHHQTLRNALKVVSCFGKAFTASCYSLHHSRNLTKHCLCIVLLPGLCCVVLHIAISVSRDSTPNFTNLNATASLLGNLQPKLRERLHRIALHIGIPEKFASLADLPKRSALRIVEPSKFKGKYHISSFFSLLALLCRGICTSHLLLHHRHPPHSIIGPGASTVCLEIFADSSLPT